MKLMAIFSLESLIIAAVAFAIGALVFRNNRVQGDALVADLQAKIKELEDKVKNL